MHTPVLLQDVIDLLSVHDGAKYIDATAGEGGHIDAFLKLGAYVLAIDRDERQIASLSNRYKQESRLILDTANFVDIGSIAKRYGFFPVEGILFDLGVSLIQLESYGLGLSYRKSEESLDMRLSKNMTVSAKDILNEYSEDELYEFIARNSEEPHAKIIARSIVAERTLNKLEKVGQLISVIDRSLNKKDTGVYARVFQALRIEVNDEIINLKQGLAEAIQLLGPEGKIAVISFHSIEDRIVKQFIKSMQLEQLTKHVISGKERRSFERSAKLRVFALNS